jgi:hypothetical protein
MYQEPRVRNLLTLAPRIPGADFLIRLSLPMSKEDLTEGIEVSNNPGPQTEGAPSRLLDYENQQVIFELNSLVRAIGEQGLNLSQAYRHWSGKQMDRMAVFLLYSREPSCLTDSVQCSADRLLSGFGYHCIQVLRHQLRGDSEVPYLLTICATGMRSLPRPVRI